MTFQDPNIGGIVMSCHVMSAHLRRFFFSFPDVPPVVLFFWPAPEVAAYILPFYHFLPSLPSVEVARHILTTCTCISPLFLSQHLHKIAITHHLLFYSKEVNQWKVLEALWWSANDNWLPLGAAMPAADQPYNGVHKSDFQWNKKTLFFSTFWSSLCVPYTVIGQASHLVSFQSFQRHGVPRDIF